MVKNKFRQIKVTPIDDKYWEVQSQFTVAVCEMKITVPKGFITDFASVPKKLWWYIPPFGNHIRAAIVHDYLYRVCKVKRKLADLIFLILMLSDGTSIFKSFLMYSVVRIFGSSSYGAIKKTKKIKTNKGEKNV